jgi:hypothetical protein
VYRTSDTTAGPVRFGEDFWLRILLTSTHMLLYLNGRFVLCHPMNAADPLLDGAPVKVMVRRAVRSW